MSDIRPLFMLADSRLLFSENSSNSFLNSVLDKADSSHPKVAYIGVSNGDKPEYFEMFREAWQTKSVRNVTWVKEKYDRRDQHALEDADIVFLAGGDVLHGWEMFSKNGMHRAIIKKYREGATLVGLSAGAVQMGFCGWSTSPLGEPRIFKTFGFAPAVVDVHDESKSWSMLGEVILQMVEAPRWGLGIPFGGGLKIETGGIVTAFNKSVYALYSDGGTRLSQLVPPGEPVTLPFTVPR